MDIVFLGTGGGRINLVKQIRATGGFRIESASADIHVDPGPGALVHSVRNRLDPLKLDCVIVTHNHTDHVTDAQVLIEGMTGYTLKKRGIVIASSRVLEDNGISPWHQTKPKTVHKAVFGETRMFETDKGKFEIEIIKVEHEDEPTFGFKLHMDDIVLGYISDTDFNERLGKEFSGCDCLVVSCIKPEPDRYTGHLSTGDAIRILKEAKPKQAVITHLGLKMLRAGPAKEAKRIEDATGVKTVAARDFMRLKIEKDTQGHLGQQ